MPITERLLSHEDQVLFESTKEDRLRARALVRIVMLVEQIEAQQSEGDNPLENLRAMLADLDTAKLKKYGKAINAIFELLALIPEKEVQAPFEKVVPTEGLSALEPILPEAVSEQADTAPAESNAKEESTDSEQEHAPAAGSLELGESEDVENDGDNHETIDEEAPVASSVEKPKKTRRSKKSAPGETTDVVASEVQEPVAVTTGEADKNENNEVTYIEGAPLSKTALQYLESIVGPLDDLQLNNSHARQIAATLIDIRGPFKRNSSRAVDFEETLALRFQGLTSRQIAEVLKTTGTSVEQATFRVRKTILETHSQDAVTEMFRQKFATSLEVSDETTEAVIPEAIEEKQVLETPHIPKPAPPTEPLVYVHPKVEVLPKTERLEIMRTAVDNPAVVTHNEWIQIAQEEVMSMAERLSQSSDQAKALWDRINYDSENHGDQVSDDLKAIVNLIRPLAFDALREKKFDHKPMQDTALRMFVNTGGGYTTLEAIQQLLTKKNSDTVTERMTERYLVDALMEVMNV